MGEVIAFAPPQAEAMGFGARLRTVRQARGLSLERLAAGAGIAPTRLALAEAGQVKLGSAELLGLINALRLPLGLLFSDRADLGGLRPL